MLVIQPLLKELVELLRSQNTLRLLGIEWGVNICISDCIGLSEFSPISSTKIDLLFRNLK